MYGIPNCDNVRKAQAWLKVHKLPFQFHNFKTEPLSLVKIQEWVNKAGLEIVLNKKSTAWRNLSANMQKQMSAAGPAIHMMWQEKKLIKRPVIQWENALTFGFDEIIFKEKIK